MPDVMDTDLNIAIGGARRGSLTASEVKGGSSQGLGFQLTWTSSAYANGTLTFYLNGIKAWNVAPLELDVKDWHGLLADMARAWPYLCLEQTYPGGVTPDTPALWERELSRTDRDEAIGYAERSEFRRHHDLSAWLPGKASLPPLWLVREGNLMHVEAGSLSLLWSYGDVIRAMQRLGDAIARRLETAMGADATAIWNWKNREAVSEEVLQAISLGMKPERVVRLADFLPRPTRTGIFAGFDEVSAAARMVGTFVDDDALAQLASEIVKFPRSRSKVLSELIRAASEAMGEEKHRQPRLQGRTLARWLRRRLGKSDRDPVDPSGLLESWSVSVSEISTVDRIEAISFWGPAHGPAVLVNPNGRRNRSLGGGAIRFTLAHEMCHLILDTKGSLPIVEVWGGVVPRAVEERANAFAAEFLMPEEEAAAAYRNTQDVETALEALSTQYQATKTLAAYQIQKHCKGSPVLREGDAGRLLEVSGRHRT